MLRSNKLWLVVLLIPFIMMAGSDNTKKIVHLKAPQFVSAKPGIIEVTQSNGVKLNIQLFGDEHTHYAQTVDGYTIIQDETGVYRYAELDNKGDLVMSPVEVNDPESRGRSESRFLRGLQKDLRYSAAQKQLSRDRFVQNEEGLSNVQFAGVSGTFPTTGTRKFLVILVNFTNKSFVTTQASFNTLMNGTSNDSFRKFYLNNSFNQLTVNSTVVGPYTLSGSMSTYGANDSGGNDVNPRLMVQEAVDKAEQAGVNFAEYDNDGNGSVDGIMVVHAGYGEEAGAPAETIWSHRWTLSTYARTYDGKTINDYTTVPELYGASGSTITGVGVVVHEFGHNLGCPDTYDTDGTGSGGSSWDMKKWDVMASGSWNNSGNTPPLHNAYARWKLGWLAPTTLTSTQNITVNAATSNNQAYLYNTPTSGEFFMIENRQQTGWDAYLPGHGLLVIHVDENWIAGSGAGNKVNATPTHQGIDLEEADNVRDVATYAADPFPGTGGKTSFTDTTTPNSKAWSGANTNKPLSNIVENAGVITLTFTAGGSSYCTAASTNCTDEWISNVTVGSLNKTSTASFYSDFTSTSVNLSRSASVSCSVTPGYRSSQYTEYTRIWIDYNRDGDFADTGEQVFSKSGAGKLSGTFTVPSTASVGATRMRVALKYGSYAANCGSYTYGEVEDYTVNIQ